MKGRVSMSEEDGSSPDMGNLPVEMERHAGPHQDGCPFGEGEGGLDHTRRWDALTDSGFLCSGESPDLTVEEGAREAWRESVRCIGRLHWQSLQVVDARLVTEPDSVFEACVKHLETATNGGRIVPTQTIFGRWENPGQEIRIWNHQLIRYAGYRHPDGVVLGDPMNVEFTELACDLGWRPPSAPGRFDLLPLVIQCGEQLVVRELPPAAVLEVELAHPEHEWFEKLGLKWYALPTLSDMLLATGRELYPCAPFNGWYMGTEIGARNLGDDSRYNLLPVIAERLGLDSKRSPLWKDRSLVVINEAVLYSFEREGIRMVDHHSASREFLKFCSREEQAGREVQAEWSWIVPPVSGSTTGVFHQTYQLQARLPNFLLQQEPWRTPRGRDLLERFT